mmetsp:Transcript_68553/g.123533  ORF Transcript_68553/g.123533 Transcript_68553/m.123533 type:complete len:223 (-) Transcript_68553:361-1029(-)
MPPGSPRPSTTRQIPKSITRASALQFVNNGRWMYSTISSSSDSLVAGNARTVLVLRTPDPAESADSPECGDVGLSSCSTSEIGSKLFTAPPGLSACRDLLLTVLCNSMTARGICPTVGNRIVCRIFARKPTRRPSSRPKKLEQKICKRTAPAITPPLTSSPAAICVSKMPKTVRASVASSGTQSIMSLMSGCPGNSLANWQIFGTTRPSPRQKSTQPRVKAC